MTTVRPRDSYSVHQVASSTSVTTAADALHDEEVERTRAFLRSGWAVAVGIIGAVLILPGDRRLATGILALVMIGVASSALIYHRLRDPTKLDQRQLTALAFLCVTAGQLGVMFVGLFSAAPLIVVLGLYFFCRTENTLAAYSLYGFAAGAHLIESIFIISGVAHDPGFYPLRSHTSVPGAIAGQFGFQLSYAIGFVMARLGRRASLESIEALTEATRLAAQREEQVNELRQDLDRALQIGGPGRFTGHVVGNWELGSVLGRGAMGEVYEAVHTTTKAEGAVKLLRRELLGERDYVERFLREVRAASALDSPNVVRVLDASTPEDPIPFLAMERLRGKSLGDLLRGSAGVARPRLAELVEQTSGVLEKARVAHIVHRDIKPHNLFLTEDGTWKVLDFGVATLGDNSGTLTGGGVIGTPTYMAPEQAKGDQVDPRADVYALGAVIYRCLTGRVPFGGRDTASVLYAVVHQMPPRPSALAQVGAAQEAVLAIALAKSRELRFQTAIELADAWTAAEAGSLTPALRDRAKALLRGKPWAEPIEGDTKQIPKTPARA